MAIGSLLWGGAGMANAGAPETNRNVAAGVPPKETPLAVPAGPDWPVVWKFGFQIPAKPPLNEPFAVLVTVTPLLFDVTDLKATPVAAGEGLTLVSGEAWTGTLKKGETREFKFTIRASRNGICGQYGVRLTSPAYYALLRSYIKDQAAGPYASARAKELMDERIAEVEKELPEHQDWAGGIVDVK